MGLVMVQAAQKLQDQGCLCECHGQGASAVTQAELLGGDVPQAHSLGAPNFFLTLRPLE